MATNTTNPELLNKTISDQVIHLGKGATSVAAQVNVFQAKGATKLIVDMGTTAASIIAENASVVASDPANFKEVNFRQKRMASAIEVSRDAVDNSALNLDAHVTGILADRIVRGIEAQMFKDGDKDGLTGFQNILLHNTATAKVENIQEVINAGAAVAHADLIGAVSALAKQPEHLAGSIWVVEDIAKLAAVKDAANNSVLVFGASVPGAIGTVFGIPVFKTAAFTAAQKVVAVLMNPAHAYGVSISEGAKVQQIKGDTVSEMKQMSTFLGEVYADGKVINPRAIVLVKTTT